MKINKWLLILILSVSLLFCSSSTYSANTTKDYTQYKLDAISSPSDAEGSITLDGFLKNSQIVENIKLQDLQEYTWPNLLPKVLDQGNFGSCVAHAFSATKDMLSLQNNNPDEEHSASFIYGFRKGYYYTGEGMHPSLALECFCKYGTCLNNSFSTHGTFLELHSLITQSMIKEAENHKIDGFIRLHTEQEVKQALVNVSPIVITIPVYDSFYTGGILTKPNYQTEQYRGGHELVIVAWTTINGKPYWKVLNSWGGDWGSMHGYCLMPFDYPINEYWAIIDSDESKLPPDPLFKIRKLDIISELNISKVFSGDSLQLQAIADNNYKTEIDVTDKVEWFVSDTSIAKIADNLLITSREGKIKVNAKYTYKGQSNNKSYIKSDYMYIYIVPISKYYTLEVLSTKDKAITDNLLITLNSKNLDYDSFVIQNGKYFKVYVGKFADNGSDEIKGLYKSLKGLGYKNSKIVYVSSK